MNRELQAVIEYMERERGIERHTLIEAVESALLSAARKSPEGEKDLRIAIDPETLDIRTLARLMVVDQVINKNLQITPADAQRVHPGASAGDTIEVELPPEKFGRIAAQTAKQAIMQRIRHAEKERIYEDYKDRIGDIVSGTVRRFERNNVIIDMGRAEATLSAKERVPTEEYQVGDRIRAYVLDIHNFPQGPEVILSRSHPDFVRRLFELEVTEIGDKTVEIKGIAREAGFRSKVAVISNNPKVDPVGACVGMRGIRVKNIVRELGGEKIDIVRWNEDIRTYVTNGLAPARLSKLELDEASRTVVVTVDADQLSLAIGKKGQNARLTAKLTGWKIDIQKDEASMDFDERVAKAVSQLSAIPGIGQENAAFLVQSGFLTIEGILAADVSDLAEVEGFTPETAAAVKQAAEQHAEKAHS